LEWEAIPTLSTGSDGVTTVQHTFNPCRNLLSVKLALVRDDQMDFLGQIYFWCEERELALEREHTHEDPLCMERGATRRRGRAVRLMQPSSVCVRPSPFKSRLGKNISVVVSVPAGSESRPPAQEVWL